MPADTVVHFPTELVRLQLRQEPVQAVSQQTPSTQWLFRHSASALQVWPSGLGPQLSFTQTVLSAQSVAWVAGVQLDEQAPSVQRKGEHSCACGGWQVPRPSQVAAVSSVLPEQVAPALQGVLAAYLEQLPRPSQRPVVPHVERSWTSHLAWG